MPIERNNIWKKRGGPPSASTLGGPTYPFYNRRVILNNLFWLTYSDFEIVDDSIIVIIVVQMVVLTIVVVVELASQVVAIIGFEPV